MSEYLKAFFRVLNVMILVTVANLPLSVHGQTLCECSNSFVDIYGQLNLTLSPQLSLGLIIVDDSSKPGELHNIVIDDSSGQPLYQSQITTDHNGHYYETILPPIVQSGKYTLRYECRPNCWRSHSFTVKKDPLLQSVVEHPSCTGQDGEIHLSLDDKQTYDVLWSNGDKNESIGNLSGGAYSVTLTDGIGQKYMHSFSLKEYEPIKGDINVILSDCNGRTDSIVHLEISGGQPPYQVDWGFDGLGDWDDPLSIANQPEGLTPLNIRDNNGCKQEYTVSINYSTSTKLDSKWIQLWPTVSGEPDAVFDLMSSLDTAQGDLDNDGLNGTSHKVTFHPTYEDAMNGTSELPHIFKCNARDTLYGRITAMNGCFVISNVELMINNYCLLISEACSNDSPILLQPVECSVAMTPLPANGTYNIYRLNGMTRTLDNSLLSCNPMTGQCFLDPTDAEGSYEVDYTYLVNGNPVTRIALFDIQDLNPQILAFQDSICGNEVTVAIRVNPAGGNLTGPAITGELIVGTNQFFFMNPRALTPNEWYAYTYTYTQTNASGLVCTKITTDSFFIREFPSVEIESGQTAFCAESVLALSAINVSPNATSIEWRDPDGIILGYSPDLTYANAQKSGSYSVKVYTAQGCVDSAVIDVSILELPDLDCDVMSRVTCPGGGDATATVGVPNVPDLTGYTFLWSNGGTGQTQNNLEAGVYQVTVTNPNGCSDTCNVTVTQPPIFNIECDHVLQEVQCYGSFSGVDSLHVTGGTPPYRYSKDGINFKDSPILTGLSGGYQTVYVVDANDCMAECGFTMPEPTELGCAPGAMGAVTCFGGIDGVAEVDPQGGIPPFEISWSTGDTNRVITGLSSGVYYVTIVDGNGCICVDSAVISEPDELELMCTIDSLACNGQGNGRLSVGITGGTPPYQALWNTGSTDTIISDLTAGTYWVQVMDQNGCMTSCTTYVYEPPVLQVLCNDVMLACAYDSNGVVSVSATGGTPPYSYLWSTGDTMSAVGNLPAGSYSVVVTDALGCVNDSCEAIISEPLPLVVEIERDSVCLDFAQSISSDVTGGTAPYTYRWTLVDPGMTGAVDTNLIDADSSVLTFSSFCLKHGQVVLQLEIEDANGCIEIQRQIFKINCCFDLAIRKTVGRTLDYRPGDTVLFLLEIFNQGSIDAYNLTVQDSMEEDLEFVEMSAHPLIQGQKSTWTGAGQIYETEVDFVGAGQSVSLYYPAKIKDDFEGFELVNYSQITRYSNAVKEQPLDEDDVPPGVQSFEYDDDIDDDQNGRSDNPVDEDRIDFARVFLCDQSDMACNDLVQVSLDEFGTFAVTPDVLLEGKDNLAMISIILKNENDQVISNTLTCQHIGMDITFQVDNGCNNTRCWGIIRMEDKMPPSVRCARPDTFYCFQSGDQYTKDTVIDNCTAVTQKIVSDQMDKYPCDSMFSGIRVINSVYIDAYGNVSDTCRKTIYFRRFKIEEVQFPGDTIISCMDFDDASPSNVGVPRVEGFPVYPNEKSCSVAFSYKDDTIQVCGATQKIIRTWTALDWCEPRGVNNPFRHNQLIKILDDRAPIVYCPGTADAVDTVYTRASDCQTTIILPEPHPLLPGLPIQDSSAIYVLAECSDFTYSVAHLPAISPNDCQPGGGQPNQNQVRLLPNGRWEAIDLNKGCHWFYYTITDACGHSTTCAFDIYVDDDIPPVAVCDAHTVVSIGISGEADLFAESVDDGSLDNCAVDTMLLRRMDGVPCGGSFGFQPWVRFCCDDIGKTIMVEFSVWDEEGNSNQCMVEVKVQNKIPPIVEYCPPSITIDCQDDLKDLSITGGPAIFNAVCDLEVDFEDVENLDRCGTGEVRRTWMAKDAVGQTQSQCLQIITIIDRNELTESDIDWPDNYIESGLIGCSTNPDTALTGVPEIDIRGCSDVAITYKDLILTKDSTSCFKILRTWTVVDWCTYDVNTGEGKFEFEQVIVIKNSMPPVLICEDTTVCDFSEKCESTVKLIGEANDDCTVDSDLLWQIQIDIDYDGVIDLNYNTREVDVLLPYGEHYVIYTVEDGCGNVSECGEIVTVIDCKRPTPVCKTGIVTVIMPSTGFINVWAVDFEDKSFDNCTVYENLEFSFSQNIHDDSLTIYCEDLQAIGEDTFLIQLWVTDEAGNQDYCETQLIVQDNQHTCDSTSNTAMITGMVMDLDGRGLSTIGLSAKDQASNYQMTVVTDIDGHYEVPDFPMPSHANLSAHKNDDILNGVSTRDIVFLQQYLLGKRTFDQSYLHIAADIDNNKRLSVSDIVALRKTLLGATKDFPNGQKSWRFIPDNFDLDSAVDVYDFPEEMSIDLLEEEWEAEDFVGIKIGDLDQSINLKDDITIRSSEVWSWHLNANGTGMDFIAGEQGTLQGCQMCFDIFHTGNLKVHSKLNGWNTNHWSLNDDQLCISWNQAEAVMMEKNAVLFTVDGVENMALQSDGKLRAEWYGENEEWGQVVVVETTEDSPEVRLYQNIPNPFDRSTIIPFELSDPGEVVISIYTSSGEVVHEMSGYYNQGRHEFIVLGDRLAVKGLLYYRLVSHGQTEIRKMIRF